LNKKGNNILYVISFYLVFTNLGLSQSVSFNTFMNPIIPGDHPDCTISKVGDDYYTTGSSFNVTPVIYHSSDLVHWEAIAQPVSASWSGYGDSPGGGCWGGHIVYYNDEYWDYFSRGGSMYFVKASQPAGPWGIPVRVNNPSTLPYSLGYDNSIFIDDNNKWYLVVKNGQPNNGIVELGENGQPTGVVYNLDWLNPSPSLPYSWAEGPVMWKHNGHYYYSFARDLGGGQYVMWSDSLTADQSYWSTPVIFFNTNNPQISNSLFETPNHVSPVVAINDSTYWIMHPLYAKGEWKGQGRQGLLNQVYYDGSERPVADYPINSPFIAPNLSNNGISWMVPHTDYFSSETLNPEWSFLGFTANSTWSLIDRPGWLLLSPKNTSKANTLIKNDGEHNYSIVTKLDFSPSSASDQAGLWIMRGDETMNVNLVSTLLSNGNKGIVFSFDATRYEVENIIGDTLWFKIVRINHNISGYFSKNGIDWTQIGQAINISTIDSYSDYSTFTGSRQGLYVKGNTSCWFDLYIYRDAYTPILAECPANQLGTKRTVQSADITVLDNIYYNNWAMYAGVEFGKNEYQKSADSIKIIASSATYGGVVEVYIDSIDESRKIAECNISGTESWTSFETFSAKLLSNITGCHDVYLLFTGSVMNKLFMLQSFYFTEVNLATGAIGENIQSSLKYELEQNYPNPFNPTTVIRYQLPVESKMSLKVYNLLGQEIITLFDGLHQPGSYIATFNAEGLSSGIYLYRLKAGNFVYTKKALLLK
jgi:xylan 1,4-beta-xylosidase